MKKTLFILLVLVSLLLTGCFNQAANTPGVWWNPFSWGDVTLEKSLSDMCANGATLANIEGNIYHCPGQTSAPADNSIPEGYQPIIAEPTEPIPLVITWNPCTQGENPALQIEPLVENGKVIPDAFMGLDLNRAEVTRGMKYSLNLSKTAYAHFFNAWDGLTREARGSGTFESTAYTVWCFAGDYRIDLAGNFRIMDAQDIPEYLDFEPHPLPFTIE